MGEGILVLGESVVDVVSGADGATVDHPGGSPANVAVALARLGASVELATGVGPDFRGRLLLEHFCTTGVEVVGDPVVLPRTSTAIARLDADGAASYEFDVRTDLPEPQPSPDRVHVHVGSISGVVEPGRSTVRRVVARHRPTATISYDINARPALTAGGAELVAAVEELCCLSDLVKASDEDLEAIYPGAGVDQGARRILGLGPAAVVVTRGGSGATCYTAGDVIDVPGVATDVVDTIGAGDSFLAGLLDGLHRAGFLGRRGGTGLEGLSSAQWTAVVERANAAAAITVSRAGANPPTLAELDSARSRPTHGQATA